MSRSDCRHGRERPVTTGHPERIGAVGHGLQGMCPQVVARTEGDGVNAPLVGPLDDVVAGGRTVT